jgi:hypothetical protein
MKKMFVMGAKALFMAVMVAIMAVVAAQVSGNSVAAYALGAPVVLGILYEGVMKVVTHKRLMKEPRVGTFRTTLEQRDWERARRRNANRH